MFSVTLTATLTRSVLSASNRRPLEHALERFESEREEHTRREQDASARLTGYEARLGEPFPWQSELDDKLARMAQLEADLAGKNSGSANPQSCAA